MKTITLPKWAVVSGPGNSRLIHTGNGEFICADEQAPKAIECAVPEGEPVDSSALPELASIDDFGGVWQLGVREIEQPAPEEA